MRLIFKIVMVICVGICSQIRAQTSKVDSSNMLTLRIDPETARGATASQVFDEIRFIPLETTKESLFGDITQLKIAKDRFVIYDRDTQAILIFNQDGKFIAKINASRIDHEEDKKAELTFNGFTLKAENDTFLIVVFTSGYIVYFDLNGKQVRKVPIKNNNTDFSTKYFSDTTTKVKSYYMEKKDRDSTFYEIALFNNKKELGLYFPFNSDRYKNDQFFSAGGEAVADNGAVDEFFYVRSYDYNIYKITPAAFSLAYRVILPVSNALPKGFMENPRYINKRAAYFQDNPNICYAIGNTYQMGNNLFLKLYNMGTDRTKKNALIYNVKTASLISIKDIEPDALSSFLPITDASADYSFANYGFSYNNGYLYTSYSSLNMFAFKEQSADKNPTYNPVLSAYFKNESKKSNPVMIQLKPKKD